MTTACIALEKDQPLTVSAPQTLIPEGNGVMITGTITDQSAGQKDTQLYLMKT